MWTQSLINKDATSLSLEEKLEFDTLTIDRMDRKYRKCLSEIHKVVFVENCLENSESDGMILSAEPIRQ